MKKLVTIILGLVTIMIGSPAFAETVVGENRIEHATFTEVGDGIGYHNGSSWVRANKAVKASGNNFIVDEAGLIWSISKNSREIVYTRDGVTTTFAFAGMYWFNMSTQAWTAIDSQNNVTPVQNGDTVTIPALYDGVDVEIISHVSGPQVDYIINDMSGWTPNPYGADGVLGFWHELKSRGHGLKVDGVTWNGNDFTVGKTVDFTGPVKYFSIIETEAEDAAEETHVVKNALVRAVNKDFFAESIDATWLASATLPVRMHYVAKGGALNTQTWVAGETYLVSTNASVNAGQTITVEAGAVVKFQTGVSLHSLNATGSWVTTGTWGDWAYFTSCDDNSVGEDLAPYLIVDDDGNCGDGTPEDVDWGSVLCRYNCDFTGAHIRYHGLTYIDGASDWDQCNIEEEDEGFQIRNSYPGAITLTNSTIRIGTVGDVCPAVMFNYGNRDHVVSNNLFLFEDAPAAGCSTGVIDFGPTGTQSMVFTHNTVISSSIVNTNFMHFFSVPTTGTFTNNFFDDPSAWGILNPGTGFTYNQYTGSKGVALGTGETEGVTVNWASHVDTGTPAWAQAYHFTAGDDPIDAGSDTAASFSLDTKHTLSDGTVDSGTVDLGFHFDGGGAAPPAGGFEDYIYMPFHLIPWERD